MFGSNAFLNAHVAYNRISKIYFELASPPIGIIEDYKQNNKK